MTKAILGLFLLVGAVELQALSVRFPKFGTPVAIEDRVVFTSVDGLRLVSIAREDGKRIWEKRYGGDKITAWFPTEAGVLLTSESKVLACDVISGELHLLSESGLEHCSLERLGPNLILCAGETGKVDQVMLFDIGEKQERWRRPFAIRSLCRSGDTICVQEGRRKYNTSRGFHFTDVRIAAVDMKTGTNRWVHSLPKNPDFPDAIVVDEYVVVHDEEGLIICLESKSGHIVSSRLYKRGADHIAVALCAYGTNALVWTQESINVVYSLSIPKLEQTRLFHPDWYAAKAIVIAGVLVGETIGRTDAYELPTGKKLWSGGQWNWSRQEENYILYSEMDRGGESTSVNEIDVKTGKRLEGYIRSSLPNRSVGQGCPDVTFGSRGTAHGEPSRL